MKKKLHIGELAIIKFSQEELCDILCEEIFGSPCEYGKLLNHPTDVLTSIKFNKNDRGEVEMVAAFSVGESDLDEMDEFLDGLCSDNTVELSRNPIYIKKK